MSCTRLHRYELTATYLVALAIIILAAGNGYVQSNPPTSSFRAGQSMYIVAFRVNLFPYVLDGPPIDARRANINSELDAERNVRKRIEEWHYFKVADKLSEADFIFLVHIDESSMEGLAIPVEAYRQ